MATTFTVVARRDGGFPPSRLVTEVFGLMVTDGNDGAAADDIAASVFGLNRIEKVSPAVKSTGDLIVVVAPNYSATGESTSIVGKAAATAAQADIPAGTYALTITGS